MFLASFVHELARAGVKHLSLAPGSRSTPLALTFARQSDIKLWLHLDERVAAFFALGLAKASGEPVALLCTSGTAAANFFPAIIEAHYARVPLIVLTADRPPELRDIGSAQTIDQIKLYGGYAKWFVEMPLPEDTPEMIRHARMVANRAVATARAAPSGVAHLNFPFREPLIPPPIEIGADALDPLTRVAHAIQSPDQAVIQRLGSELSAAPRGVIVVGPQTDPNFPLAVTGLSARLGYPILADVLSQTRCGAHDLSNVIDAHDAFLRDATTAAALAPEVILRFGDLPTSKPVLQFMQRHATARHIFVDVTGWNDAPRLASDLVYAAPTVFCSQLAEATPSRTDLTWLNRWREVNRRAREAMQAPVLTYEELFEGRVFMELAEALPEGATLYASSSMPVRDLDTFFAARTLSTCFLSNRGANGIDGVVSSALGASVVSAPLVLVIGDIAFYHDLNGLLAAKRHALNATIIVINNDGGGIFSFLPQATPPAEQFEELFGTPHGLTFRPAAELYGAHYWRVTTWAEFRTALSLSLQQTGLKIIELPTQRPSNVTMHRAVWQAVAEALRPVS